jgi:DNA primase
MEMDKISFPEASELLAKRFAVELVYENRGENNFPNRDEEKKKEKEELFELYQRISGSFHHFLLKKPEASAAKHYIISRGINEEMIECFSLGYSPNERYWLHKFLSEKGYSGEFLGLSGLFSSKDPHASLFQGRLMFPIKDQKGRTIAFGGRYLENQDAEAGASYAKGQAPDSQIRLPPKYINSPELGIFKKGETLYALDIAMPEIRRTKTAYIAEGYMDVIALHQAGVKNAIAPLGTAFTSEQAKLLMRWVEKLVFFFDSDAAGQAAVQKGIFTCRRNGLACAVVAPGSPALKETPGAGEYAYSKDPADVLKTLGHEALKERSKCIISDFEYLLKRAGALNDARTSEGKAAIASFLFPYLELQDSQVAKTSYIEAIADAFELLPAAVEGDFRSYLEKSKGGTFPKREDSNKNPAALSGVNTQVRMNDELSLLIALALDYLSSGEEKLISKFRSSLGMDTIEDNYAKEIFIALEECIRYGEAGTDDFLSRISSTNLKKIIIERSVSGEFSLNSQRFVEDGIRKITIRGLERRQEEIILKLRTLKKSETDELSVQQLLSDKMFVDEELLQLKQGRFV